MLFHPPEYFHGLPTWPCILHSKYRKIMQTFGSVMISTAMKSCVIAQAVKSCVIDDFISDALIL